MAEKEKPNTEARNKANDFARSIIEDNSTMPRIKSVETKTMQGGINAQILAELMRLNGNTPLSQGDAGGKTGDWAGWNPNVSNVKVDIKAGDEHVYCNETVGGAGKTLSDLSKEYGKVSILVTKKGDAEIVFTEKKVAKLQETAPALANKKTNTTDEKPAVEGQASGGVDTSVKTSNKPKESKEKTPTPQTLAQDLQNLQKGGYSNTGKEFKDYFQKYPFRGKIEGSKVSIVQHTDTNGTRNHIYINVPITGEKYGVSIGMTNGKIWLVDEKGVGMKNKNGDSIALTELTPQAFEDAKKLVPKEEEKAENQKVLDQMEEQRQAAAKATANNASIAPTNPSPNTVNVTQNQTEVESSKFHLPQARIEAMKEYLSSRSNRIDWSGNPFSLGSDGGVYVDIKLQLGDAQILTASDLSNFTPTDKKEMVNLLNTNNPLYNNIHQYIDSVFSAST